MGTVCVIIKKRSLQKWPGKKKPVSIMKNKLLDNFQINETTLVKTMSRFLLMFA